MPIRHFVVPAFVVWAAAVVVSTRGPHQGPSARVNPVPSTPASLAAGKKAYDLNCAGCHGNVAQGSVKAGVVISIIAEQGGKQPPDLTDDQWDHGSSDGEIYTAIMKGIPPTMMAGWEGRITEAEAWSIIGYLRALASKTPMGPATAARAVTEARATVELDDYLQMPVTADPQGDNTRAQLARVNFLRDEPGGRRFFVNDLNGPLYIVDKKTQTFTRYLDFNGLGGRSGLFAKFTFERNFATGLINVVFDPDYARNGVFYTLHTEDPTVVAPSSAPKAGAVPGLDVAGYETTAAIVSPTPPGFVITREAVMIAWTDRDITDARFEGTARELLRLQLPSPIHPLGEMTFDPTAKPGDPEWRVMFVGVGDSGTGEQRDLRRLTPQRLDTLNGKILRIVPDLREHVGRSTVSDNGRYRIPADNPFVGIEGARKELWAVGLRNPHRLVWHVDRERSQATLLAFNIGLTAWETVVIIKKGANYGYPLREGPQAMTLQGMTAVPAEDTIPWQVTETVTRGSVTPTYPVIAYPHTAVGGDAIASGFVYRGTRLPSLRNRLLFGDITTGRMWYVELADLLRADDDNAATMATLHEVDAGLRPRVEAMFRARGGRGDVLPGAAAVAGRGRVDMRLAEDADGELYVLTKSDGMIRRIVSFK